jgi:hypothetical protein
MFPSTALCTTQLVGQIAWNMAQENKDNVEHKAVLVSIISAHLNVGGG